ncbi:MAG: kinase-like domain-containing protein [Benjaminiella poitrasii]|nr:MAG: kinase-like domain-containing protein [Benjaminiella poitrasii]
MEYCSLGDLSHYIKQMKSHNKSFKNASTTPATSSHGLPERIVRHFLKQLANALKFLRSQNLIHRDIKPQNLLLSPSVHNDNLPILKVADFGFARFLPNASLADTLCGSPLYMGPEILSYKKYDAKADLWSVGAVLYEILTGRPPFRAQNHIELLKKIQENNDHIHFPADMTSSDNDLKDLIRHLLKKNPVERISFEDFFQHPAVLPKSYEPPPFAPTTTTNTSINHTTKHNTNTPTKNKKTGLISPIRSTKSDAWSPSEPHSGTTNKNKKQEQEEEQDMLQGYVVLDLRSIETNQFADELKATPQSSHAVNIPKPASSPLMRERKSSGSAATSSSSAAGSALAKALSKASVRLFGTPSPPKDDLHLASPPLHLLKQPQQPQGFFDDDNNNNNNIPMKRMERLACMAHAVATFGDQKYDSRQHPSEAVALYVKALALLEEGLYVAQEYWQEEEEKRREVAIGLNDAVQWMRDRFNGCLDRAERVHKEEEKIARDKKREETEAAAVEEENCIVEKLLYNRALEMSRAAAVHELVGENITECEQDYQTAIWMLEAILQVQSNQKEVTAIEEDDRRIIHKFIDSIRHRILVLRKKKGSEQQRVYKE